MRKTSNRAEELSFELPAKAATFIMEGKQQLLFCNKSDLNAKLQIILCLIAGKIKGIFDDGNAERIN